MGNYETFAKAPIREAVLEIIVSPTEGTTMQELDRFRKRFKERFPEVTQQRVLRGEFKIKAEEKLPSYTPTEAKATGFLLRSPLENKVVQARVNGFAFSKLQPYENWGSFLAEAQELWRDYVEIAKPEKITRISLRYINRIDIPTPFKDFNEYFLTWVHIAPDLPQEVSQLFLRLEVPRDDIDALAIIILTVGGLVEQNKLPIIFDIDVVKTSEYRVDMKEAWEDFGRLRDLKNEIFFNTITEKTKELFR